MVVHACDLCVRKVKTSISPRPFGQTILAQQTLGQPERPWIKNTMRTVPMRTSKVDLWPQTCAHMHATRCIDTYTHVYPHTKTLSTTMRSMGPSTLSLRYSVLNLVFIGYSDSGPQTFWILGSLKIYRNRSLLGVKLYRNKSLLGVKFCRNKNLLGVKVYRNRSLFGAQWST